MDSQRKIILLIILLVLLLGGGTLGYSSIEGWPLFESLYMTVITLATVGFKEVHDLSYSGKVFTIILIITGTGTIAYTISFMVQFMVEGQLRRLLGRRKLQKQISNLKGHYIICGYGRIGRLVSREFASKPIPFIVVEQDLQRCEQLDEQGYLYVQGDATCDDILEKAGIHSAKGLISAVTSDSSNVFITLTARGINPDLYILARSSDDNADVKLIRAGANKVISPYTIGASRIAQAILRPSVVDFIDIAIGRDNFELQIEEILVRASSSLAGKTLISSALRKELGLMIVGIKRNERMNFNPDPNTEIAPNDILIALGEPEAIKNLERIASDGR